MDDIADTLQPKSEQLDAIELVDGPRVFTVKSVTIKKDAEQPAKIYFEEFPRPWRPGVNQRRVLAYCWGRKSSEWTGRKMRLFYDPDVTYGRDKPGGTRISHLSHIDGPIDAPILISQGRASTYHVEPLTEPTAGDVTRCSDEGQLRAWWDAYPQLHSQIKARVAELRNEDDPLIPDHAAPAPGGDE